MESSNGGYLPINQDEIADQVKKASSLLKRVSWHPRVKMERLREATPHDIIKNIANSSSPEVVQIADKARQLSDDSLLVYDPDVAFCLDVVRKGLALGMHAANLFSKASNFYTLKEQQARGALKNNPEAQTEFREKNTTTSAVLMFVAANYIVSCLGRYKNEELDSVRITLPGLPEELHLANFIHSLNYMVYYHGFYTTAESVKTPLEFVKTTLLYYQDVLDEIEFIKGSLKYTDAFEGKKYKLEGEDFTIEGFSVPGVRVTGSVDFNRIEWGAIVGNTMYKHSSKRTIQFLMCYDVERKMNPVNELGGFPSVTMEYGPPGTGKSMGISATATELSDRCTDLGINFLYHPIPQTVVSTYQGGSSENMEKWFRSTNSQDSIIYAPIDDGDGKLRDRGARGTSAGVIEVVESFLVNTEGASAAKRGNRLIQIYTNLPETLDKAVLSRVQKRSLIEGAVSLEDFLDQDYIWWRAYEEMVPGFVKMQDPSGYEFMSAQDIVGQINEELATQSDSRVYKIQQIIERTFGEHKLDEHLFFAKLYHHTKREFPGFTSRDVRNIQSAVNTRLTDFDFPEEWMADHARFFARGYDEKLRMLRELMMDNMQGLSFATIRFQEVVRYLDNMAMIVDREFESKVAQRVEEYKVEREARRRLEGNMAG
ncbi:AAA family ATPase [Desulfopila sp. IMCC35008]|uniref:AAA family ATPase n=1 Tax=Desulfopila sp. IMCC35008 TaxID=2653858 RepID=UPI0013D1F9BD|nr:AAA family ATPase [Desulfopila sp. IMCC35008]